MADKYLLRVTGGSSYDPSAHKTVSVNSPAPFHISNPLCEANINVRIRNYHGNLTRPALKILRSQADDTPSLAGLPKGSPNTSPYFSHPSHTKDQYSISFTLLPKSPIPGNALIFGNDFDHPIRDRLPLGFNQAVQIVKRFIDPGIVADAYADKPHLYGPALSSINILRVGKKTEDLPSAGEGGEEADIIEEGADADDDEAEKIREEKGVPRDAAARKKWFLNEEKRNEWEFERGRLYHVDFFNPYLDFNGEIYPRLSLPIYFRLPSCPLPSGSSRPYPVSRMKIFSSSIRLRICPQASRLFPFNRTLLGRPTVKVSPYPSPQSFSLPRAGKTPPKDLTQNPRSGRYVLKNKDSGDVYFVLVFSLLLKEDVERAEAEEKGEKDSTEGRPEGEGNTFVPREEDLD
ncbi:MAG: hypothetical protein M1837_002447 [Sclerophora amabilis]|nr:MAG: hypothetical protein M1837_002447 [Sclerophora amabilis]